MLPTLKTPGDDSAAKATTAPPSWWRSEATLRAEGSPVPSSVPCRTGWLSGPLPGRRRDRCTEQTRCISRANRSKHNNSGAPPGLAPRGQASTPFVLASFRTYTRTIHALSTARHPPRCSTPRQLTALFRISKSNRLKLNQRFYVGFVYDIHFHSE